MPQDKDVSFIALDGDEPPVVWKTTASEVDWMFRESVIRGVAASCAVEEGGVVDEGVLNILLAQERAAHRLRWSRNKP